MGDGAAARGDARTHDQQAHDVLRLRLAEDQHQAAALPRRRQGDAARADVKQHIVPVLLLKHFVDQRGHVWTYDKIKNKRWSCVPEESAAESHYYSLEREDGSMDTAVETLFAGIESEAAPIYERLVEGELPKGRHRAAFAHFLGMMYARSPSMRRFAADVHKVTLEATMQMTFAHDETFQKFLAQLASEGRDISDPTAIRRSLNDLSGVGLLLPKAYVLKIIELIPTVTELFLGMKWSVLRPAHHFFVTCDNPVCHTVDMRGAHPLQGNGGLSDKTSEITFPMSPKRLLVLHWTSELSSELAIPRFAVEHENHKRLRGADRQVYAHLEHRGISRLLAKYPQQRPTMETFGMEDAPRFGEVSVPRKWPSDARRRPRQ